MHYVVYNYNIRYKQLLLSVGESQNICARYKNVAAPVADSFLSSGVQYYCFPLNCICVCFCGFFVVNGTCNVSVSCTGVLSLQVPCGSLQHYIDLMVYFVLMILIY